MSIPATDQTTSPHTPKTPEVKEEDLVQKTPQSAESTPRRLQKQIDIAIGDHRTSASMINAVVGPNGLSTRGNFFGNANRGLGEKLL